MVTPDAPVRLLGQATGPQRWFLGASTEWPGVIPADVETGDVGAMAAKYPAIANEIRAIAASVKVVA